MNKITVTSGTVIRGRQQGFFWKPPSGMMSVMVEKKSLTPRQRTRREGVVRCRGGIDDSKFSNTDYVRYLSEHKGWIEGGKEEPEKLRNLTLVSRAKSCGKVRLCPVSTNSSIKQKHDTKSPEIPSGIKHQIPSHSIDYDDRVVTEIKEKNYNYPVEGAFGENPY
ncbi:hypothetical protein RHMOL_Rhmol06G0298500 [Rhododendron molle]|uniref:Uncharacterized protein n=1 Tax=Rhododendron molle TaxID=49168 RepID=A0ACC0NJ96_RHOML|nr:hypothetical protein RHMOL_Rhmol06G0298500 [Rhododendron molle]